MEKINKIIDRAIDNLGLRKRIQQVSSMDVWPKVVGKTIAQKTKPKKVRGSKLWVEVSSSVWMSELVYWKPKLISRINKALGDKVIEDIIFINKGE